MLVHDILFTFFPELPAEFVEFKDLNRMKLKKFQYYLS
jgi:hypothetical protein